MNPPQAAVALAQAERRVSRGLEPEALNHSEKIIACYTII
jgi:hypothetical protein